MHNTPKTAFTGVSLFQTPGNGTVKQFVNPSVKVFAFPLFEQLLYLSALCRLIQITHIQPPLKVSEEHGVIQAGIFVTLTKVVTLEENTSSLALSLPLDNFLMTRA